MRASTGRRSPALLNAALGAGLAVLLWRRAGPSAFSSPQPAGARGARTTMRGFKEDFEAWRGSLTPEESTMLKKQAAGEFNKKFRKSDEFKKDLPDEKVQSFSKILGKFFEAEADDYKKEAGSEAPDPDGLLFKGTESKMDFRLKSQVVEIDRDAERRYHFAALRTTHAAAKGEYWPSSSPLKDTYYFQNNDSASHDMLVKIAEKTGSEVKIPPVGEEFSIPLPAVLFDEINEVGYNLAVWKQENDISDSLYKEAVQNISTDLILGYYNARDTIENDVKVMKDFFKSQSKDLYKTKADVMKEIWKVFEEKSGKKMPPLDDEFLAELEQIPAVDENSFRHPWGIADKLYKSEAIDAFGFKYLLGVFETIPEAEEAFTNWNAEFEQARADMESELDQWSKQEQARLDADVAGQEAMKVVMEQGRA